MRAHSREYIPTNIRGREQYAQPQRHARMLRLSRFTRFFPLTVTHFCWLTIRFALAGFYPSPWGHNSIKYTIALCDILSFLMNVSPRSPLAAQSMSFGASLMPSISHSDNSAFHLKWCTDTSIFKALIKFRIRSAAGKSEQWCAAVPIYIGGNQLPHIFCSEN